MIDLCFVFWWSEVLSSQAGKTQRLVGTANYGVRQYNSYTIRYTVSDRKWHNDSATNTKRSSQLVGIFYSLLRDICTLKIKCPLNFFLKFIESITDAALCKHENDQTKKHHFTQSWRGNSTQFASAWHRMPLRFCHQPCKQEEISYKMHTDHKSQCERLNAVVPKLFNLLNSCQQVLVLAQYVLQERLLELGDLARLHFVQVSPHTSINDCYLLFNGHWSWKIKAYIQKYIRQLVEWIHFLKEMPPKGNSILDSQYCPCLRSSVRRTPRFSSCWVAASKSEPNWAKAATSRYWASSSFMVPATWWWTQVNKSESKIFIVTKARKWVITNKANLLHGPGLGSRSDTWHGQTDVDGGTNTLVEQLSLQEDLSEKAAFSIWFRILFGTKRVNKSHAHLSVRDGDDISWNVGWHVTSLCLDNGKGCKGAAAKVVIHLSSSLQQTGMQVEDVSWVSLATRGTTEQQGHLTVGDGLRKDNTQVWIYLQAKLC